MSGVIITNRIPLENSLHKKSCNFYDKFAKLGDTLGICGQIDGASFLTLVQRPLSNGGHIFNIINFNSTSTKYMVEICFHSVAFLSNSMLIKVVWKCLFPTKIGQGSLQPHFEKPHLVTGRWETGKSKSAQMGPFSNFQKYIHDWSAPKHRSIMITILRFGIVVDSSTFGLPHFATPCCQMRFFKMGFAENLGHF